MRYLNESIVIAVILTVLSYAVGMYFGWITVINWLEVFAVFTSYSCTWLCSRETRLNYPIGAISTAAWSVLFYNYGMYALAIFNLYLVFSLTYGWFRWKSDSDSLPVTKIDLDGYVGYSIFGIIILLVFLGCNMIFNPTGIAGLNPIDILLAVLSGVAQLMLDNKKIENWILWAIINIISIPFYFYSGLTLTAFQYIFFLINTVIGYKIWRKSYDETNA